MLAPSAPHTQAPAGAWPAHEVRSRIIGLRQRMTRDFLELGALLSVVEEHELWRGYAGSFREYCEDPEIGISYGTVRKLIRLHRMAESLGLAGSEAVLGAGVDRAYAVLKASCTREEALQKLQESMCLPVREVQLMYRGDDVQSGAIEALIRRFEQMNSPSRVTAMVWAYWRMTYEERLEFHSRISQTRRNGDAQESPTQG